MHNDQQGAKVGGSSSNSAAPQDQGTVLSRNELEEIKKELIAYNMRVLSLDNRAAQRSAAIFVEGLRRAAV